MIYAWNDTISDVKENTVIIGGRKDHEGHAHLIVKNDGWWVRVGNISLYVGKEEPMGWQKGDRVRLTMEKVI